MFKKLVLGFIVALVSGALIYGAIYRTQMRADQAHGESPIRQASNRNEPKAGNWDEGNGTSNERQQRRGQSYVPAQVDAANPETINRETTWISILGEIIELADDTVQVRSEAGEVIILEGMQLRFAYEQGFSAEVGSQVMLAGFYESGEFVIGSIEDLNSGMVFTLREESGRPFWAGGRGRRGL